LRYGLHNHIAYLDVLRFLSQHGERFFTNNSVNGVLNGYLSSGDNLHWDASALTPYIPVVHAGTLAASLVALATIVLPPLIWRGTRPGLADLGAASICTVAGSPVAWEHHYGILFPLYLVALKCWDDVSAGRRRMALGALLLSWILVADFIPFTLLLARTPFSVAEAHCFFGALILLTLLLICREPPESLKHGALRLRERSVWAPFEVTTISMMTRVTSLLRRPISRH